MTTTAALSYIGTCNRCGTTRTIAGSIGRFIPCTTCATDAVLLAERDAFLAEHPRGIFPMGTLEMKKVRGKLGKRECDEACTSARGDACTCKCAGLHHGAVWAA